MLNQLPNELVDSGEKQLLDLQPVEDRNILSKALIVDPCTDKWRLFDSTHISVKISLTLDELKILLEPFMTSNPQYNTAAVAIINRQPCDINMKSCDLIACRTRVCGKHIVCSKCDVDDTRRANRTKNKLFYCNICMDPNTDSRSNVLGEHE